MIKHSYNGGDIVFIGTPNQTVHWFVVEKYYSDTGLCDKYDMGSDSRIQTKQPFKGVQVDEWEPGKDFVCAYRPNYKGNTSEIEVASTDGLGRKKDITTDTTDKNGRNLYDRMKDASLRLISGGEVAKKQYLSKLSYLTIPYYDFNGKVQTGEMIVARELADEVLLIFQDLYNIKYPIESMNLIDNYTDKLDSNRKADDWTSIQANNTSAFNYRYANDGLQDRKDWGISPGHSNGVAIDINPLINPYIENYQTEKDKSKLYTTHWPEEGKNAKKHFNYENATRSECLKYVNHNDKFLDRDGMNGWTEVEKKAKADKGTKVNKIFAKYNWVINDDYPSIDIQHYSKVDGAEIKTINWDKIDNKDNKKTETSTGSTSNKNSDSISLTSGKVINVPTGLGGIFLYEGWQLLESWTKENGTAQRELIKTAGTNFDSEGFGIINGRYVIACTTTFGKVGDYIDFYQSDGTVFHCIMGDEKNQNDNGCNQWGHKDGKNIVEFIVNTYDNGSDKWYRWDSSQNKYIANHGNPGEHANNGTPIHLEWAGKTIVKAVNLRKLF